MPGQNLKRHDGLVGEQARNMNCCLWTRIETRRAYVVGKNEQLENVRALTPFFFNCLKCNETREKMYGHKCVFTVSKIFIWKFSLEYL
jgi:hypothetical protein